MLLRKVKNSCNISTKEVVVLYNDNELQHFGVKGMKWGVRRYENKDGSLTPAGRKRYNDDGTKKTHKQKKAYKAEVKDAKKQAKKDEKQAKKDNYTKGQVRTRAVLKAVGTYAITQSGAAKLAVNGQGPAGVALGAIGTIKAAQILYEGHKDVKAIKERDKAAK